MNNRFRVSASKKESNKITYNYSICGEWSQYFDQDEEFFVEFSENMSMVPESIAVIPLLCNVLPIAWVCDAEIVVDELDMAFFHSVSDFKKGYMAMYPMLSFAGKLTVGSISDNSYVPEKATGAFFSGGVDGFSTLISQDQDRPALITLWGSDVSFEDVEGWNRVKRHVEDAARAFAVNHVFVKSCLRMFLKEKSLSKLVACSGEGWWHGFQYGIGLIGHAAPYAYKYRLNTVFFASSHTIKDKVRVTCASDPSIDNHVRFCSCQVAHDGYEVCRQEKVRNICEFSRKNGIKIKLRVCWRSSGGGNCCRCEKCYRTIMAILVEGFSPGDFGFFYSEADMKAMIDDIRKNIVFDHIILPFWEDIQRRYVARKDDLSGNKDLTWMNNFDFRNLHNSPKRKLRKVFRKWHKKLSRWFLKSPKL